MFCKVVDVTDVGRSSGDKGTQVVPAGDGITLQLRTWRFVQNERHDQKQERLKE